MARRRDEDDEVDYDDEDDRPRPNKSGKGLPKGTPTVYVHKKCKCETDMPIKHIRKYLENPFELGEEPTTHCSECDKNVPWKDCYWAESKVNLYEYIDDMRAEMVISGEDPRDGTSYNWVYPIAVAIGLGLAVGAGGRRTAGMGVMAGIIAAVLGAIGGGIYMLYEYQQCLKENEKWNDKLVKRYYKRHPEMKKKSKKPRDDEDDD